MGRIADTPFGPRLDREGTETGSRRSPVSTTAQGPRRQTPSLTRATPASGTSQAPAVPAASDATPRPAPQPVSATRRGGRFVLSKLTARVLAINMLALILLVGGLLYLGRYEDRLISAEADSMRTEALIFAGSLAEGAAVDLLDGQYALDPELARQMVRRLYETTDTRTRLFDFYGNLVVDSRVIGGPGGEIEVVPLPPPETHGWLRRAFDTSYNWVTGLFPATSNQPLYNERPQQRADDYPLVVRALAGDTAVQVWSTDDTGQIIGVAVPVQRLRAVLGAVLVTQDTKGVQAALQSVREDILTVSAAVLAITVLLSLYLAGTITRPINRLAAAADAVRRGHGRKHQIPDLANRRDEIGDLSGAMRDMIAALWNRMDAIERFAADVAHEIKNPLTSLRSAVETIQRVQDTEQQRRLLSIVVEDVQRLNRLISDISDASRLDAELSRAEADPVDVGRMLEMLADLYGANDAPDAPRVVLEMQRTDPLIVAGLEDRLVQVFRNIIANAISFSPPQGTITIRARRLRLEGQAFVEVEIGDQGPGIPEAKLAAIFDRFYSERPSGEKFGTHSGLGLSISKQIIDAHRGQVFARNRDGGGGAVFTARIPLMG